ncbi:zinc finger MYM-type 1-like [Paramuricea clavata]|uniref:Zinc finger MYM-type 1-like n=1 Tax=Paramuricea clavata TaxID=317549 RepID=A0A7D9HGJ7_PARCT|nr:zinc finger MYM-type 1-like [Paramuricea clavata]
MDKDWLHRHEKPMSDGKKHERTRSHLTAFKMWKMYGVNVQVDSLLSQARRDEIQHHNEEELAFIGHYESEDSLNIDKLGQCSNIKEKLIMQTYDGASVMSGHINGVQTLVRQEYLFAQFVHCAAHRLNLVLCQSASSIAPVKIFFINTSAFSTFTSNAPRRKAFLTSHNLEFPNPGDTRWYYRACVIVLYKNYEKLLDVFDEVTEQPDGWDDESLDKILEQSSILYSVLQNTGTDFSYGISRIERFKNFVSALRTDEDFDKFYQEAVDKVGQPVSRVDKKHNYKQLYFEKGERIFKEQIGSGSAQFSL